MSFVMDEVVNPYNDPHSAGRRGLVVRSPWSNRYRDYIREHGIKALYFNSARGWHESDFGFLTELDGVEEVNIVTSRIDNFTALEGISTLRELSVTGVVRDRVDFRRLEKLERCYLYWWPGAESVLEAPALERAYFDRLKLKDYGALAGMLEVRELTIGNSPLESLAWLNDVSLRELHLLNCRKLMAFEPIGDQRELRRLSISGSKSLYDLGFLSNLSCLHVLDLSDSGVLKSLEPLRHLRELRAFSFAGRRTTVEDGDLSVLTELPELSMLMFAPRRGYSHRLVKAWDWRNFDQPDVLLEPVG